MTEWLPDIWCCNSVFDSPDTDMLITWHWYVYTWQLIPDTWYLTPVLDMLSLNTWYLTPNIWYLTIDMLSLGMKHLTWCCDTWLDTITPDTCIIFPIHDYHFYGDLAWLLYCYQTSGTPELLRSWPLVFLNSCNRETPDIILLILYSYWSP